MAQIREVTIFIYCWIGVKTGMSFLEDMFVILQSVTFTFVGEIILFFLVGNIFILFIHEVAKFHEDAFR